MRGKPSRREVLLATGGAISAVALGSTIGISLAQASDAGRASRVAPPMRNGLSPHFAKWQWKADSAIARLRAGWEALAAAETSGTGERAELEALKHKSERDWWRCVHALTMVLRHVPKTLDDSDLQLAMMPLWDEFEINRVRLRHPRSRVVYFRRRLLIRIAAVDINKSEGAQARS